MIKLKVGEPKEAFTHIVAMENSGFVIGPIIALKLGVPFIPIRPRGKLRDPEVWEYECEFGTFDFMTISKQPFRNPSRLVVIDDYIAHGRMLSAIERLVEGIDRAKIVASCVLFEVEELWGKESLEKPFYSLFNLNK
jgi:adenine phosphoribosyltransferase